MRGSVLACLLIAGCMTTSEEDCRTANWYARGERDGLMGNQPWIDVHAAQCARFSVQPSRQDYMAGWADGKAERSRRVVDSIM